jgi:hypothetical protein
MAGPWGAHWRGRGGEREGERSRGARLECSCGAMGRGRAAGGRAMERDR